jgi:Asp-tRNA(Asn)/Glu-tRNA(Gln) amidotransferase A subunit family amidase
MARTVADISLMWRVLAGPDDGDPMAAPVCAREEEPSLKGARVALLDGESDLADAETTAVVNVAATALERAGSSVERLRIADFDEALRIWHMLFCVAGGVATRAATAGSQHELSAILRDFLTYFEKQPPLSAESLLTGLVRRDQVRACVLRRMRPYAALLAPVSSGPAFKHGEGGWGSAHPADYIRTMRCSQFANGLGLPALVVPAGRSRQGLPIGVQLIGRPYGEEVLLTLGAALEARFGFEWPPLARAVGLSAA